MWLSQVEFRSSKQDFFPRKRVFRRFGVPLDSGASRGVEPARGHPDAGERGSTHRKQHLDEVPPRARPQRAPEVCQPHLRQPDSPRALDLTRRLDHLPDLLFVRALRPLLRAGVLRALVALTRKLPPPHHSRILLDSATLSDLPQ